MPLYEYVCGSCGQRFDKMVRFSEMDQRPECPTCRSNDTRKQISTVAAFGSAAGSYSTGTSCGTSRGGFS